MGWHLLDILFPESCLGCHIRGESICDNCSIKIRQAERETENDIYACFDYRDPIIKRAIWNLKYYHKATLGKKLGKLLYESMQEIISELKAYSDRQILIIPVPISNHKSKTRGYNQAEIIAKGFIEQVGSDIFEIRNDIVWKRIDTKPQARIHNKIERLRNIKNVFDIRKSNLNQIKGRTIIIIDDVTTTGGTINEIIKILKNEGAEKVLGFAVAH